MLLPIYESIYKVKQGSLLCPFHIKPAQKLPLQSNNLIDITHDSWLPPQYYRGPLYERPEQFVHFWHQRRRLDNT